ncbi:MAG: FtsX-like permease family protein [Acidobacteria bacterium]|nr:FtsX-like permease family protein [Acidobacteriota bacterium]
MNPPRLWRALVNRVVWRDRRHDIAADLTEEFRHRAHADSPRSARRWYRRQALGFVNARLKELRTIPFSTLVTRSDIRVAARQARRQPAATLTVVVALAAVIGLSVIAFTLAKGFFLVSSVFPSGDTVYAALVNRAEIGATQDVYPDEVRAWAERARSIEMIGAAQIIFPAIEHGDRPPFPLESARVSPAAFARIAPPPVLGRHLSEDDALPGAEPVMVISYFIWRSLFDESDEIVGTVVPFGGRQHTVVGVMPRGWLFPAAQEAWIPLSLDATGEAAAARVAAGPTERNDQYSITWVILEEGASPQSASEELTVIARELANGPSELGVQVVLYADALVPGPFKIAAGLVLGILLVFLCGVSLNVATLVLSRCAMRSDELAVRAAMGAPRVRIVTQLFLESLLPSLLAALLATFLLKWVLLGLDRAIDGALPMFINLDVSPVVFIYAATLAFVASGLAGVLPALRVTRTDHAARLLNSGGARSSNASLGRVAAVMLELQLVAALTLLGLGGLFANAFATYTQVAAGPVPEDRVLTAMLYRDPRIAEQTGANGANREEMQERLKQWTDALRSIPGAEAAAITQQIPKQSNSEELVQVDGDTETITRRVRRTRVGPGLFETLSVTPTLGRVFDAADAELEAFPVVVVSESFAADVLGSGTPLGRKLRTVMDDGALGEWAEIVGVVPDLAPPLRSATAGGEIYRPLAAANPVYAAVRFSGSVRDLAQGLRATVQEMDPTVRVTDTMPYSRAGWEVRSTFAAVGSALAGLGGVAMLLSLAGVYSLASLAVTTRTREIGTRVALGAPRRAVLQAVLGRTARQLGIGFAAGIVLALLLAQLTSLLPFEIPMSVGVVVPLLAFLLLLGGLLASWVPARRALRIEPMDALRSE